MSGACRGSHEVMTTTRRAFAFVPCALMYAIVAEQTPLFLAVRRAFVTVHGLEARRFVTTNTGFFPPLIWRRLSP